MIKIIAWNVNGIRSILEKELIELIENENPDILCLGEIKLSNKIKFDLFKYEYYHVSKARKGYAGTCVYSNIEPISVKYGLPELEDLEGRVITIEFKKYFLIHVYTPNSGQVLQRLNYRVDTWDKHFWEYIEKLQEKKSVIVCGDLNCALNEIDIHSPKTNLKSAGFTIEERNSLKHYVDKLKLIDTFRYLHPQTIKYSYWSYLRKSRTNNKGWRIDYFFVSKKLIKKVKTADIITNALGSDHAPILIEI
jgi:exodeoxyribonuclease-3